MRSSTSRGGVTSWANKKRGGGRAGYLSKWKEDGEIRVWMHTAFDPIDIYRHAIPQCISVEDRKTGEKKVKVFSKSFTCHETEETLEGQYFREDDGARKHPPERCGLCKLVEFLYQQVYLFWDSKGKKGIAPETVVFAFEGDDDDQGRPVKQVLYAGGITKLFEKMGDDPEKKDFPEELTKPELKKLKPPIYLGGDNGTWKQNAYAKPQTVFAVVDNEHPEKGVQVAVETGLLGEKVKEAINKRLKSKGPVKGNPQTHPYCIEWEYDAKEENFQKKYDATVLEDVAPTAQVLKLIRGDVPDTSEITKPFNQQSMRATLERHCLVKDRIPWDKLFPTKEESLAWEEEDKAAAKSNAALEAEAAAMGDAGEGAEEEETEGDEREEETIERDEDGVELVVCDNEKCEKPIRIDASECPHCGEKYDVAAKPPEKPEPEAKPKMRSRSEATAAKEKEAAEKPKGAGAGGTKRRQETPAATSAADNQDDDIPFLRNMIGIWERP